MQLLRPKKLLRLAVSGAWHCPILTDAEVEFGKYLEGIEFRAPDCPIVDNVTGEWLPTNDAQLRVTLARHISHPVYWEHGIKSLIARGCNECIEMGYGKHLAKFGFFIDRDITWRSFCF
jgi:acyl transferase domain-containing protein